MGISDAKSNKNMQLDTPIPKEGGQSRNSKFTAALDRFSGLSSSKMTQKEEMILSNLPELTFGIGTIAAAAIARSFPELV